MTRGFVHRRRIAAVTVSITLFTSLAVVLGGCALWKGLAADVAAARTEGNIRVSVRDQAGRPVPGVTVSTSWFDEARGDWRPGDGPGRQHMLTNDHGTADIKSINAGRRRITLTLPTGFRPAADGVVKEVVVVALETVTAAFVVLREEPLYPEPHP